MESTADLRRLPDLDRREPVSRRAGRRAPLGSAGYDLDLGPERAVLYLRVSLDRDGDERAVTRQREDGHEVARRRGWEVVDVYQDNSVSASKASVLRPEYERMAADYRAGKFDAIICYDLDRLTRQPRQLEDWIDHAEKHGLVIVTLNGEADLGTDGGRMYARIKAAVARAEVERKGARQRRANQQRAEGGYWQFSNRPYGYRRVNGVIEVVEDEAAIVREGFARYVAGESYYAIAADWTARGVPTFGGGWSMQRVRQILRNPHYAGIVTLNGKPVPDAEPEWEPLIDARTWSDYMETKEGRTRAGTWSCSTKHLMSGLLVCGVCGARMLARPDGNRKGTGAMAYACTENWCVSMPAEDVDNFVEALILARLQDPKIVKRLRHAPDTAPVQEEIATLRKRREAIVDLLADGVLDRRRARAQATDLTARIDTLTRRLAAMRKESPLTDLALARSVPSRWRGLTVLPRRRVIDELGLRITVNRGRKGPRKRDADGNRLPDRDRLAYEWVDYDDGLVA